MEEIIVDILIYIQKNILNDKKVEGLDFTIRRRIMKRFLITIFILFVSLFIIVQVSSINTYNVSSNAITEKTFKKPLSIYFREQHISDSNENVEIFYYEYIPNSIVEKYREFLVKLNIPEDFTNGKDGIGYNYEYLLPNKKWLSINIVSSVVTGNTISLSFESPIID